MKPWGLLLLLPLTANAQPPCPTDPAWHTNMCADNGAGATWCEALGPQATDGSYPCVQAPKADAGFAAPSASAVPEVSSAGLVAAFTLLGGSLLIARGRRLKH